LLGVESVAGLRVVFAAMGALGCAGLAAAQSSSPKEETVALPATPAGRQAADAAAVRVLILAIDHVGVPRGITGGDCIVQGRVIRVERGEPAASGSRVDTFLPCSFLPNSTDSGRYVRDGSLREGGYARISYGVGGRLLAFERLARAPGP
jgi:hypothetical protein